MKPIEQLLKSLLAMASLGVRPGTGGALHRHGPGRGVDHIIGHSEPKIPLQHCPTCGPTIVVERQADDGDLLYCRICGSEVRLHRYGDHRAVEATARNGSPLKLAPTVSSLLINDLADECLRHLELESLPPEDQPSRPSGLDG